jgi:hypothetical protein
MDLHCHNDIEYRLQTQLYKNNIVSQNHKTGKIVKKKELFQN